MTLRSLEITNVYELHDDVVTHVTLDIKPPTDVDGDYSQYLYDTIHPHTGVGHEDGNSAYFVESTDGLTPRINEEYGT